MAMRTECSHYYVKTARSGDRVEGCHLGAAPDAPEACPRHCLYFEKRRLSTTGFVYGSLSPERREEEPVPTPVDEDAEALLADVRDLFEEIAPQVAAEEAERRQAADRAARRRRRKRRE